VAKVAADEARHVRHTRAAIDELFTEDCVFYDPGKGVYRGRDEIDREGGRRGWRLSGISGDQYLAELSAYEAELVKDAYVVGATVFTSGPTTDWQAYGLDGLDVGRFYDAPIHPPKPWTASPSPILLFPGRRAR